MADGGGRTAVTEAMTTKDAATTRNAGNDVSSAPRVRASPQILSPFRANGTLYGSNAYGSSLLSQPFFWLVLG